MPYLKKSIAFYAADGTSPFFVIPPIKQNNTLFYTADQKFTFDKARLKYLMEWRPKIVIICAKWSEFSDINTAEILINFIGRLDSKILFIEQPPELFFGDRNAPQYLSYLGLKSNITKQYLENISTPNYIMGAQNISKLTKKYNYCKSISVSDLYIYNNKVLVIDSGNVLYIDDDHLSYAGAMMAKNKILQSICSLL